MPLRTPALQHNPLAHARTGVKKATWTLSASRSGVDSPVVQRSIGGELDPLAAVRRAVVRRAVHAPRCATRVRVTDLRSCPSPARRSRVI